MSSVTSRSTSSASGSTSNSASPSADAFITPASSVAPTAAASPTASPVTSSSTTAITPSDWYESQWQDLEAQCVKRNEEIDRNTEATLGDILNGKLASTKRQNAYEDSRLAIGVALNDANKDLAASETEGAALEARYNELMAARQRSLVQHGAEMDAYRAKIATLRQKIAAFPAYAEAHRRAVLEPFKERCTAALEAAQTAQEEACLSLQVYVQQVISAK